MPLHSDFLKKLMGFEGQEIRSIFTDKRETPKGEVYMVFQFHIDDSLLCFEIAKDINSRGGRCFIMNDTAVDGAGIFPIGEDYEMKMKKA